MINLDKLYSIREGIPKIVKKMIPRFIRQKINKIFFKYYFLPTNLKNLPQLNYPVYGDYEYQKNLIKIFNEKKKQTSFMTCPHLLELLLMKFNNFENLNFLDVGGEKIDFYLDLKKNFKNAKYFLFNQKSITEPFHEIQKKYNFNDFFVIDDLPEIFKKKYDFVNFGSCIHYINNYEELLQRISEISKYIFFSGTHLYDSDNEIFKKNMVVKQVNTLPKVNYNFFYNRKTFFEIFEKKDFELIFESLNLTDMVNYENFNSNIKNIQYSDFLFSKKF